MGLRVIIPVAGEGTRMRPHTHTKPKVLLQVAGKPMLSHILDELKQYDVEEICLVVGHKGEAIREYVTRAYDYKFQFVTQSELKGLGHAIWMTREHFQGVQSPLLIILGDTLFDADFKKIIGSDANWIGVKEVDDPRRFGIVALDGERITAMVEKPERDKAPTNLAIVGIYYFNNAAPLFTNLDKLIDSGKTTKGEFQLTDAMQLMLEQGALMKPFKIAGWFDCGKPETLLETNRILLEKACRTGKVNDSTQFDGSLIRQPVSLGEGVKIENSIIGPHVTIAQGATIRSSIVRNSIISSEAVVENLLLDGSIISDHAHAFGAFANLNLGDSSELRLH
ncbi:NTP transferase domain-containing protein [bacterium]|nr:NTP transferase domain-containing protein [bacterium]